eukprot:2706586-Rhodomonas_salina.1
MLVNLSVSARNSQFDYSIRRALKENYPSASTPRDVHMKQGHYARVYSAWTGNTIMNVAVRNTKWKPSIVAHALTAVAAYFTLQTLAWVAARNICKGLESLLPAQPCSQRDARS